MEGGDDVAIPGVMVLEGQNRLSAALRRARRESVLRWFAEDDDNREWSARALDLIAWFKSANLPTEPFRLSLAVFVATPDKLWKALAIDIGDGPGSPRAPGLIHDLQLLRSVVEDRG